MFDKGVFSVDDNFRLLGHEDGALFVDARHTIKKENLNYHRICHGYN